MNTGDHLDYLPHAEGYVNVLDFSEFIIFIHARIIWATYA